MVVLFRSIVVFKFKNREVEDDVEDVRLAAGSTDDDFASSSSTASAPRDVFDVPRGVASSRFGTD